MSSKAIHKINHLIGILFYITFAVYFVLSLISIIRESVLLGAGGIILNILSLILEILGPIYMIYFLVQLIDGFLKIGEVDYDINAIDEQKKVSVIIPIHNVPIPVLEETLVGLTKQTYKNFDVWVGDDSPDENLRKKYENLCKRYNFTYFYAENKNLKAGMLNLVIPKTKGDYVSFFDVDHVPTEGILTKFVAILNQYPEYEFVQAKYGFRNATNVLHVWSAMTTSQIFCSQNARRTFGAVLFQGASACFRRSGVQNIPENVVIEDYSHSISLMTQKKQGYFLDEFAAQTLLPSTLDHQMSQLYRWIKGQNGSFVAHIKDILMGRLSFKQSADLFFTSTIIFGVTSFYELGFVYGFMYLFKTPYFRALGLDSLSQIIMPILIMIIYGGTFTIMIIYFIKSKFLKLKAYNVPFYVIFGGLASPYLKLAALDGLFSSLFRSKKSEWNKKLKLGLWGAIFSAIGIIFFGLTVISTLDLLGIVNYYGDNFYFAIFLAIGFALSFVLPFILIAKNKFKTADFEEKHIFH
jgi:cellulose synthase/poly-beta-1,6-N-acetylglucosamine synthase-like glycosyltransferase